MACPDPILSEGEIGSQSRGVENVFTPGSGKKPPQSNNNQSQLIDLLLLRF